MNRVVIFALFLILGQSTQSFIIKYDVIYSYVVCFCCWFLWMLSYRLNTFSFFNLWKVFIMDGYWILLNAFSVSVDVFTWCSYSDCLCGGSCDFISYFKLALHSWDILYLVVVFVCFFMLLDSLCSYLLRILCYLGIGGCWFFFSFLLLLGFSWFFTCRVILDCILNSEALCNGTLWSCLNPTENVAVFVLACSESSSVQDASSK